jgi:hypothetical protein
MTKKHKIELTDAEVRKITSLSVADEARKAKAAADKWKARPENRKARLVQAEREVQATKPLDPRCMWRDMITK